MVRGFKSFRLILVISLWVACLTTFSLQAYCEDDWVLLNSNENSNTYYNPVTIKIDKPNNVIKVWIKRVFTEKGKINLLNKFNSIAKQKYADINYVSGLYLFNYSEQKISLIHMIFYSKSGNELLNGEPTPKWHDIVPHSVDDLTFNRILKDYNITR
jgi:surface-adhesin protein E